MSLDMPTLLSGSAFPPQIPPPAPPISGVPVSAPSRATPLITSDELDRQPRKRLKTSENMLTERKRSISQPRPDRPLANKTRRPKTPGPKPTPLNLYDRPMDLERSGESMPAKPEVPFDPNALLRVQTALRNFMS